VVLAVVVAGLLVFGTLSVRPMASSPASVKTVADGPALLQALTQADRSVNLTAGGPWGLFSYYGIAAQSPFSPNVIPYASVNQTVNACGAAFNGLTMWNGTIPVFNGTLNSGTAPFWQFAYFSNTSQQILVVTDVGGSVDAYPPIAYPGACQPWYDLPAPPGPTYWTGLLNGSIVDSPTMAENALAGIDQNWLNSSLPTVEIYTSGPGVWGSLGDRPGSAGVLFNRCGLLGVAGGAQPIMVAVESLQGVFQGWANLTTDCNIQGSGYGDYDGSEVIDPGTLVYDNSSEGTRVSIPYQVAIAYPNGTLTGDYDGWGLASWMTSWNLTGPNARPLPGAEPTCGAWVPSLAACTANPAGWYGVIVSASGQWINSFGESTSGNLTWSVPITALVSHQELVIEVPSSWNVTGDVLTVSSTTPTQILYGSITL